MPAISDLGVVLERDTQTPEHADTAPRDDEQRLGRCGEVW
jgi:hypothetical protein